MPYHFDQIPSTQAYLKELLSRGGSVPHLDYVLADEQTGGVGRHGRSWISERGNLFISIYLKDFSLPLTWIPHWVGAALVTALIAQKVPQASLKLKWPNDLLLSGGKKAAGILCEKIGDGVVIGIGVNLISAPALSDRETASILSVSHSVRASVLAEALIRELKHEPALGELQAAYSNLSWLKPTQKIEWVDLHSETEGSGVFLRYGKFGELIVRENEVERALYSEEVKVKTQ